MRKINILVTGANGQTGQELQTIAQDLPEVNFVFAPSKILNIANESAVFSFFRQYHFDWVINCAAYTAVDKAEAERDIAWKVNADGPAYLASACREHGARLIHLSTDYVFHSHQNTPYRESDPTHPQGVYAASKLAGEDNVLHLFPEGSTIVRTSWVYSTFGHNFVKTMLKLGRERQEIRVVSDQIGSPTYARDIAKALTQAIFDAEKETFPSHSLNGIFHFSNEGVASWYDFAHAIFDLAQISCRVIPIDTVQFPTPAKRPPFSVLNKGKWKSITGQQIPHWRESLQECLQRMP